MKAIETHHNGYKFRSRLEARWAVFFESWGISYKYEFEGFELKNGWYLPDFFVPTWDAFVEIKGNIDAGLEDKFFSRYYDLVQESNKPLIVLYDRIEPWIPSQIFLKKYPMSMEEALWAGPMTGFSCFLSSSNGFKFIAMLALTSDTSVSAWVRDNPEKKDEILSSDDIITFDTLGIHRDFHDLYLIPLERSPGLPIAFSRKVVSFDFKENGLAEFWIKKKDAPSVHSWDISILHLYNARKVQEQSIKFSIPKNAYCAARGARFEHKG